MSLFGTGERVDASCAKEGSQKSNKPSAMDRQKNYKRAAMDCY
jgi:hypothetical protein